MGLKKVFKEIMAESESRSVVSDSLRHPWTSPLNSPGQNTGVGSLSLLRGIFPTQESKPGLPNCRQILYQLSHKGSPRILEWVAFLFSREIFPTQGLNQGLLHCRQILYQPSYQGSPTLTNRTIKTLSCRRQPSTLPPTQVTHSLTSR